MRRNFRFVRAGLVCFLLALLVNTAVGQDKKITEGSLRAVDKQGAEIGLCPLKKTDVKAEISGFISRVTVTQTFQNPFADAIEAVYTFPLPNDAAVDDLTIEIGERAIHGIILERKKAQEAYETARQQGKIAALLQQQRPNIFTQSVANITPNAEIKVVISYVETLKYADDAYEFVFPMTIGERYIPSSVGADDAAKISPKSVTRPAHTVSLELKIDAGVSVENLASKTHEITAQQFSASRFLVKLQDENEIPNRDFVLKYKTAGTKIEDAVLTHKTRGGGGFFTLLLQPPDRIFPADTMPKEIVFVLDTSGSMNGFPIEKAKEAMKLSLDNLNPQDTFNLITFAGDTQILFDSPVPATPDNLRKAREFLASRAGAGGTEMMKAVKAALAPSGSQNHIRIVCFMTDGYVGNEAEIIAEVQKHPNARVFGFGIGNSVNRYLLDEISREGRGEVEYVALTDDGSAAARRFFERVRNPLLTDISLEFQGIQTAEIFPREIPDLFDAKPISIAGRYTNGGAGKIILRGRMQGQPFAREIAVDFPELEERNGVLATLWARQKVADLTRQDFEGLQKDAMKDDLKQAITNLGLEFRLLTPFTSFVAVEDQIVTDAGQTRRVEVPVASPKQMENLPVSGRSFLSYAMLSSGVVNATVSVSSEASVSVTDSKISTNIAAREIVSDYDKGKSVQPLLSTAAGITQTAESQTRIQQGLISSNGQRPTSNDFTVDGMSANTGLSPDETSLAENLGALPNLTASGGTNSLSAIDAVSEVTIKTMASAKEQRTPGALVNFATKGGTNAYRGSLFETFGNEIFNANDFFANSRGRKRAPARLNQFGATLGGFFVQNRVWFFGSFEGLRLRQAGFSITEVPDSTSRQSAPSAFRPILNAFPIANGRANADGFAEYAETYANPASHDVFGFRVDGELMNNLRVGGRYNFAGSRAAIRGDRDFSLNTLREIDAKANSLSAWTTFTPSSVLVIDGRVNFSRNRIAQKFSLDDFGGADSANLNSANDFTKYDFFGLNSALVFGDRTSSTVDQFHTNGSIAWILNNHQLTFGADFRRLSSGIKANQTERNALFSGVNSNGAAALVRELSRLSPARVSLSNFSLFAQDEWRISPRVNLNFGLRWDADFAPEINAAAVFRNASPQMPDQTKNFAPRASVAWDATGNGKIVVRGGIGLFFDYTNAAASEIFANSFPFARGSFVRSANFDSAPTNSFKPLLAFANDLQTPRTWQVFAEYQQEFLRNHIFTATYTGAFGRRLFLTRTLFNADPDFRFIRLVNNEAESNFNSLQLRFERRFTQRFLFNARYALSKSTDNFSPDSVRQGVFVSQNPALDKGASDFDARQTLSVFGSFDIPAPFSAGTWRKITKGWTLFGFANARSAFPVNVTYTKIRDFGAELLRPDLNSAARIFTETDGIKRINAAAFAIPANHRQGGSARNSLRGFPFFQLDTGLQRNFRFSGESNLRLTMEVFNLLNNVNFADMNGNLGTQVSGGVFRPNNYFGQSVSTFGSRNFTPFYLYGGARTIQLSAKFVF